MRLHTNVIEYRDILRAIEGMPNVYAEISQHGSRSHDRAFEVKLEGNGTHKNSGAYGAITDEQAATWDEWGIFLHRLYEIDAAAVWGSVKHPVYRNAEDFHWQTGDRFKSLAWENSHKRHAWKWNGEMHWTGNSARVCKCGAIRRNR